MAFKVLRPGVLTLVQDSGRIGYQHLGLTTGGPMDEIAFRLANWLLNNPADSAMLEITAGQLELQCTSPVAIALTGANLNATVNQQFIPPWQTLQLQRGDKLAFNTPIDGLRSYLAVPGGFCVEKVLGSNATVMREKLGGLDQQGSKLQRGDTLSWPEADDARTHSKAQRTVPENWIPDYRQRTFGVIPGYQFHEFPQQERLRFFHSDFQVTAQSDRMGFRLAGPTVHSGLDGIVSEGIALGAIQVPPDGQPIVLMRDRQTIGGYPKIGTVFSLHLSILAQQPSKTDISFYPLDLADAEIQRRLFEQRLGQL